MVTLLIFFVFVFIALSISLGAGFLYANNKTGRIKELELVNADFDKRLWILENPAKFTFNQKVKLRVIDHDAEVVNNYSKPCFKEVDAICKGEEAICTNEMVDMVYYRKYHVEYNGSLHSITESEMGGIKTANL